MTMEKTRRPAPSYSTARPGRVSRRGAGRGDARTRGARGRALRSELRKVVKVGLHLGDTRTRVAASKNGEAVKLKRSVFTNIVGFLKLNTPLSRMPEKSDVLYAEQAVKFLQQVDLQKPIHCGLVNDVRVCRQFVTHVCSAIDPSGACRLWGVSSIPAVAGPEEYEKAYRSLKGPLDRVILVPEPYLVAEGMRLEKQTRQERLGEDLTRNCLVIDIGAGTTDLCLVRGAFPTPDEQMRLEVAGNFIDEKIFTNALVHSPTLFLSRKMVREIKEEQAFVGGGAATEESIQGSDLLAFTDVIRSACDKLLQAVTEAACSLLGRCDQATAAATSRNVILTGGGSRIRNLSAGLEANLKARGHLEARVLVPEDYKDLVSRGALRFAEKLTDEEWRDFTAKHGESAGQPGASTGGVEPSAAERGAEAVSWMDVGLRAEASPSEEPEESAESGAPPAAQPPPPPPLKKEKKPDFTAEDLEQLQFFKGL